MHHRTTLAGALGAVFFLAITATPALAAPRQAPATMKAKAPAAMKAKAPDVNVAITPMSKTAPEPTATVGGSAASAPAATKGSGADTPPRAEPAPTEPPPAAGASIPWAPDDARDRRRDNNRYRGGDHSLTSIVVPIGFFLAILLLVGTIQYMGFRKDRNKHQTLRLMVEKGAQIPVALITTQKRSGSDLRRGLVLVGAGLGIALFLLMTKDARNSGAFGLGLIPALIGAGYLLAWKLEGRNPPDAPPPALTYTQHGELAATRPDESSAPTEDR